MSGKVATSDSRRAFRTFYFSIALAILAFVLWIFLGLFHNNKDIIERELLTRARAHFSNIVVAREWNAHYGGVYVEKRPGMESNPFLAHRDITTDDGVVYTMKNPALMTREISEFAKAKGEVQFRITSLQLLNPNNAPDEFERKALNAFKTDGVAEVSEKERLEDGSFFRYMAPLVTTEDCLECHLSQGYKIGDIRGGISVRFPISEIETALEANLYKTVGLFFVTAALLMGLVSLFVLKLRRKLLEAEKKIAELAITDELTKVYNRRFLHERLAEEVERGKRYNRPLSCIMMDIDYFKSVNDRHGHDAGDLVLRTVAHAMNDTCRATDCLARYGGEEFVQVLPETPLAEARSVAEKIRVLISEIDIAAANDDHLSVTASFGVASFSPEELKAVRGIEDILKAADEALYDAKRNGRNQVALAAPNR